MQRVNWEDSLGNAGECLEIGIWAVHFGILHRIKNLERIPTLHGKKLRRKTFIKFPSTLITVDWSDPAWGRHCAILNRMTRPEIVVTI